MCMCRVHRREEHDISHKVETYFWSSAFFVLCKNKKEVKFLVDGIADNHCGIRVFWCLMEVCSRWLTSVYCTCPRVTCTSLALAPHPLSVWVVAPRLRRRPLPRLSAEIFAIFYTKSMGFDKMPIVQPSRRRSLQHAARRCPSVQPSRRRPSRRPALRALQNHHQRFRLLKLASAIQEIVPATTSSSKWVRSPFAQEKVA
jgi:hypothetical protein